MPLFRRKGPVVVRKGVGDDAVEERKTRKVGGSTVEIRKVTPRPEPEPEPAPPADRNGDRGAKTKSSSRRSGGSGTATKPRSGSRARTRDRRPRPRPRPQFEVITPPETDRKQMLVRTMPHQKQIVILEGPVLVEHYVARSDKQSLIGNVYLGKVRNVLPGMEAAFVDFGEGKNGVLYAGDIQYDPDEYGKRRPRIEKALSPGDDLLVQVVKDAMGHKGARLTNEISLAGRYLVLAPASDMKGISRRLPDDERERLRRVVSKIRPDGAGVIVRTAAAGASEEDLTADVARLAETWEVIQERAASASAPALLHEEPPLEIRVIREHLTKDFRRLLIDDKDTYERVTGYLNRTAPELASIVRQYEDELSLFERFHVEDQLRKALDRRVWLPSGGHVVIESTEALHVIDVNTGRFVGHSNLEETVLQNNLEAAEEIARQLRLRDIGGIIVIDFIDMEEAANRQAVLTRLKEHLAKDKTRTQVFDVSNLGLVEMTRKNVSDGLLETFSETCDKCEGRGILLHEEAATAGAPISRGKRAAEG